MQSSKPHIAARVRDAREWKEISQVAMAKRLDIARQTYLDLESGKTEPRITTLLKIAEITGRPLTWFIEEGTIPQSVHQHTQSQQLIELLDKVPEPLKTKLIAHQIGMISSYIDHLDSMK
ncbi:transcriptional regulator [Photobacterium proteolyticum]|uniref:Transcriptional regulator n=1 Tax=Photobacterium proteolyticum TaxID=1903952 RepID=A0A1Q9H0U6_9GAMM|nr:helix-turn-helix domain-containing protein [Photobacterium proteolyticum]OLQ81293.1 transcriptional regulator [Photobacterium proteolyticum]